MQQYENSRDTEENERDFSIKKPIWQAEYEVKVHSMKNAELVYRQCAECLNYDVHSN
jgi:hypothetical protein